MQPADAIASLIEGLTEFGSVQPPPMHFVLPTAALRPRMPVVKPSCWIEALATVAAANEKFATLQSPTARVSRK